MAKMRKSLAYTERSDVMKFLGNGAAAKINSFHLRVTSLAWRALRQKVPHRQFLPVEDGKDTPSLSFSSTHVRT